MLGGCLPSHAKICAICGLAGTEISAIAVALAVPPLSLPCKCLEAAWWRSPSGHVASGAIGGGCSHAGMTAGYGPFHLQVTFLFLSFSILRLYAAILHAFGSLILHIIRTWRPAGLCTVCVKPLMPVKSLVRMLCILLQRWLAVRARPGWPASARRIRSPLCNALSFTCAIRPPASLLSTGKFVPNAG